MEVNFKKLKAQLYYGDREMLIKYLPKLIKRYEDKEREMDSLIDDIEIARLISENKEKWIGYADAECKHRSYSEMREWLKGFSIIEENKDKIRFYYFAGDNARPLNDHDIDRCQVETIECFGSYYDMLYYANKYLDTDLFMVCDKMKECCMVLIDIMTIIRVVNRICEEYFNKYIGYEIEFDYESYNKNEIKVLQQILEVLSEKD